MTTSILVTGGTGTLGRPVAQRLRDAGASVTVLSRHPRETVQGIRYTAGDLSTGAGIEAAVQGAEVIVHAAGRSWSIRTPLSHCSYRCGGQPRSPTSNR